MRTEVHSHTCHLWSVSLEYCISAHLSAVGSGMCAVDTGAAVTRTLASDVRENGLGTSVDGQCPP